jgi:phosphate transport system substrate-binding protein
MDGLGMTTMSITKMGGPQADEERATYRRYVPVARLHLRFHWVLLVPAVLGLITGCGLLPGNSTVLRGTFTISGSTALQPLATEAAQHFTAAHPQVTITVSGGGSLVGLENVTSHISDIGDSDVYADPALYPDPNLTDHLVCVIPFAMITNRDVGISSLTTQQIIDIFSTGKIKNWQQVGGPNLAIVPVVRPPTSGTRATFRKYILGGRDQQGTLLQSDSSQTVLTTVAHTAGAIGYLALSVVDTSVRQVAIDGHLPTVASIQSGQYAFWGFEHMYTIGEGSGPVSSFLDYMLTLPIQQLAQSLDYIPISAMAIAQSSGGTSSQATEQIAGADLRRKEEWPS